MAKQLVAYFSASAGSVTKGVAEKLAAATGADLFRIQPETPYTAGDLDWTDKQSRSSLEEADENSRPTMKQPTPDVSAYDVIYVGFPIWWYREPRIIDTFLEGGDFAGKTIIPFATSGSSQMGDTGKKMQAVVPAATVEEGRRFPASVTEAELKSWADQR